MAEILDDIVAPDVLKRFEETYNREVAEGNVTTSAKFDYACCLVRSHYAADINKGLRFLEQLYETGNEKERREYIYFLAIGNTKIKDYNIALKYVKAFLHIEPFNMQVQNLEKTIRTRMKQDGLYGLSIVGGAALVVGGLITLGLALKKSK